jgi:hypothetical protein
MASFIYTQGKYRMANGELDWDTTAGIKILLATSGYTPNIDHDVVNDITPGSNEASGTGYIGGHGGSGRKSLTRTTTIVDASDRVELDASDLTWSSVSLTNVRYGIIFKEVSSDADSWLIALIDFQTNRSPSAQDLVITWDATGIIHLKED